MTNFVYVSIRVGRQTTTKYNKKRIAYMYIFSATKFNIVIFILEWISLFSIWLLLLNTLTYRLSKEKISVDENGIQEWFPRKSTFLLCVCKIDLMCEMLDVDQNSSYVYRKSLRVRVAKKQFSAMLTQWQWQWQCLPLRP